MDLLLVREREGFYAGRAAVGTNRRFTRLRNNAKKYFDAVERGESVEIYRHGKPIAILSPVRTGARERWKTGNPLKKKGVSLAKLVLAERRGGR